jgi:hypothetical protein
MAPGVLEAITWASAVTVMVVAICVTTVAIIRVGNR